MTAPTAKAPAFFSPLEGLRGIAAVGVVLYHSWYHWQINGIGLIEHGNLFVDLFFVISGFVISHIYISRLRERRDLAQFAVLRTARLYPLHLFTLLVLAAYTLGSAWAQSAWGLSFTRMHAGLLANNTWTHFLENLLMLQALLSPNTPSFNSPSWSISTEYFTYFIFALAVILAARRGKLFLSMAAALALLSLGWLFQEGSLTRDERLLRCIGGFFSGALVYLAWVRFQPALRRRLEGAPGHLAELAALALAGTALWYCGEGRAQFLVLPCFALLVFLLADGRGIVTRALRHRYIQNLGKWSYSIYMVHFTIILVMSDLARVFWVRGPSTFMWWHLDRTLPLTLLLLTVVLLVASLTYRYIEDPPRRWAKRWVARHWGERPAEVPDAPIGAP
ncbi:MAG TPA: acyltransferase [Gammaproteobacteria bacterium]|jgi:peptidoglycan/LPS O-acetylase OafA/YrhL